MKPKKHLHISIVIITLLIFILLGNYILAQTNPKLIWQGKSYESTRAITVSPDRKSIALGIDWKQGSQFYGKVVLIDRNGNTLWTYTGTGDSIFDLSWSPDGTKLAVACRDHHVYVLDSNGNLLWKSGELANQVWSVDWSPSGDKLIVGVGWCCSREGYLYMFSSDGRLLWVRDLGYFPTMVRWNKVYDVIAVSLDNKSVLFIDENGNVVDVLKGLKLPARGIDWSADGNLLAIGTGVWTQNSGYFYIYNYRTGELMYTSPDLGAQIIVVKWNPSSGILAVNADNGNIVLYDLNSGQLYKFDREFLEAPNVRLFIDWLDNARLVYSASWGYDYAGSGARTYVLDLSGLLGEPVTSPPQSGVTASSDVLPLGSAGDSGPRGGESYSSEDDSTGRLMIIGVLAAIGMGGLGAVFWFARSRGGMASAVSHGRRFGGDGLSLLSDRFEFVEMVGSGGTGVVWKVRDKRDGRVYALKVPNYELLAKAGLSREYVDRLFLREAVHWEDLGSHPNIVRLFEFGHDPVVYLKIEYVPGVSVDGYRVRSLRDLLNHTRDIPLNIILKIIYDTAKGLAYAHNKGLAHLDIKPENLMLTGNFDPKHLTVKITDWGIARLAGSTGVSSVHGLTLSYAAPEIRAPELYAAQGIKPGIWSDICSLGAIIHELLTGSPSPHLTDKQETMKTLSPIEHRLLTLATRMMNPKPDKRPNATMIIREIELLIKNHNL